MRVGRVTPGSAARQAGLVTGDTIITINGRDVATASAELVARLIRFVCLSLNYLSACQF